MTAEILFLKKPNRYAQYLQNLKDEEMEFEILDFLQNFHSSSYKTAFADRAQALFKELADRISHSPHSADSVLKMNKGVLGKIHQLENQIYDIRP